MKQTPVGNRADAPAGGRVLVVDDHRAARESMADVLQHAGHETECRSSAAEALSLLERERFDCIVTDLKMPGMTGVELLEQCGVESWADAEARLWWSGYAEALLAQSAGDERPGASIGSGVEVLVAQSRG